MAFADELGTRYEAIDLVPSYLCRRLWLRLRPGQVALPDDMETALRVFGGVLNCRIDGYSGGMIAVIYIAD